MIVLVQSPFHTTWASLLEIDLEVNSLDWNGNELEHELELEDMKRTLVCASQQDVAIYTMGRTRFWSSVIISI